MALEAHYQRAVRKLQNKLTIAQLNEELLGVADQRDRREQRAAAARVSWAVRKARQAAEQRARECRVCLSPPGGRDWNPADLDFHRLGHPANWTWRPIDDAVKAEMARMVDAIALLVEKVGQLEDEVRQLRKPTGRNGRALAYAHRGLSSSSSSYATNLSRQSWQAETK